MLDVINNSESNVRGYCRLFPTVFDRARGSELWDTSGRRFIDFFCGAGTLNYGHNNPRAKSALIDYIERDGIQHSLDTVTTAKRGFLSCLQEDILKPRNLEYRVQFTGPTGTNAVEAAIKVARKATGRSHIVAFTHAYHGHSLGALSLTANQYYHEETYGSHNNVSHMPFDGFQPGLDSASLLDRYLSDSSSGLPKPAAIILETVQGEGGIHIASIQWLRQIQQIAKRHDCLLIIDDIQVGNGRTGKFFSFERAGIKPDIVCLSKSLGGGLPISVVLLDPAIDVWQPGQHTGTFRGNNLAFVTGRALLDYWRTDVLRDQIKQHEETIRDRLQGICQRHPSLSHRGIGMIHGLDCGTGTNAREIIDKCFAQGLLLESSGAQDEVLKLLPALTISPELLNEGLDVLEASIDECLGTHAECSIDATTHVEPPVPLAPAIETPAHSQVIVELGDYALSNTNVCP